MASRFRSLIGRRQAILGMLAAGGAAVLPVKAPAVPAAGTEKAYAAFFLGQGGYLFSWGIPLLEREARKLGFATEVFSYTDLTPAWTSILRKRNEGYKIALVGYSLGNTTATYLQRHLPVDLLLAISESSLGRNHPINKENTKRSVLWYGSDLLSNAGVNDGFDQTNYIESMHLLMDVDPRVVNGVLAELRSLVAPARRDERIVAANAPVPAPIPRPTRREIATAPPPAQQPSAGRLPPASVATSDVTCKNCWGFVQSLGEAASDPWMQ
ncbi:MAG TPA: hypothetical protein VKT99_00635 [Xanthobacteraceae bacterium]|jgi:hypothetical protein|nr:hypothetical protein [Xanthobacteraceae bacterium]